MGEGERGINFLKREYKIKSSSKASELEGKI